MAQAQYPAHLGGYSPHPFVGNTDPTNEFMYQVRRGAGEQLKQQDGPAIDLQALTDRLQLLGLHQPSRSTDLLQKPQDEGSSSPYSSLSTPPTSQPLPTAKVYHPAQNIPSAKPAHQRYPATQEIHPDDSISVMYRPYRHTTSGRKGGTDIDAGEGFAGYQGGYGERDLSTFAGDEVTQASPRSTAYLDPTVGPSLYTPGTHVGGMYAMRDRLLREQAEYEAAQNADLNRSLDETARLAAALAKLEATEEQVRTLQATLIAEKVVRTQIEKSKEEHETDMRECRDELAGAIRALRRAREEGKRGDEDRKGLARSYEAVRAKLYKYEQELAVRDALARGREKGRQEAWDEAGKWMGISPPIPIEPIRTIPETVIRHTPMMGNQPHLYGFSQPQQQTQHATQQAFDPQQQQRQAATAPGPNEAFCPSTGVAHGSTSHQRLHPTHIQQDPSLYPPLPPHNDPSDILSQAANIVHQQQSGQTTQNPPIARPQSQHTPNKLQPQYTAHTGNYTQTVAPQPSYPAQSRQSFSQYDMHNPPPPGHQQLGHLDGHDQGNVPPPRSALAIGPYGQTPHSVPYPTSNLPPQQPMRAATVVNDGSTRQQQSSHQHAPLTSIPSARHESTARPHPADSYLDRVEHDPKLQHMLSGAPSKTIHSSNFPQTESGQHYTDKPLPNPAGTIGDGNTPTRAQSTRRPSVSATTQTGQKSRRRQSLSEGVHPMNPVMNQIPDGDRYPAFPGSNGHPGHGLGVAGGRQMGHSRNTSFGSVDPAAYTLPPSTMHSTHHTPQTQTRNPLSGSVSARQTPQSQSAKARSRLAGALRNGTEMGMDELSQIEEEHEARHSREQPREGENEREPMQSMIMQNMKNNEKQRSRSGSMPPMRWQPRLPVMPAPLGGRPGTEPTQPHGHPHGPRPTQAQIASLQAAQSHPSFSSQGPRRDEPPRSHPFYMPKELDPQAVGGGIEDDRDPRHSALGLEGLDSRPESRPRNALGHIRNGHDSNYDSSGLGGPGVGGVSMKAPTITVQPPSSRSKSNNQPSQVPSAKSQNAPLPRHQPQPVKSQERPQTQKDSNHPSKRQTTIITEYYNDPPQRRPQPQPHEVPLPRSRAATMTTAVGSKATANGREPHEYPLPHSRAPTVVDPSSVPAANIPLPASRSHAPTAYDAMSPRSALSPTMTDRSHWPAQPPIASVPIPKAATYTLRNMPSVSIIDYAAKEPLPDSRPTTTMGTPKAPARTSPSETQKVASANTKKPSSGRTNDIGGMDPAKVPLPASRAPTARHRASTYARTEGTIEEVTEEESGREDRHGKKRW